MVNAQIPWNISIRYYLDGQEYNSATIAGQTGKMTIKFVVTKNQYCSNDYYDNYALEATFKLDAEKTQNLTASGGTVANSGSDKQISYIILPGQGIDTEITADVTDFEMGAVTIAGIKLNLDLGVDTDEIRDKADALVDGIDELNEGAQSLDSATASAASGASSLSSGTRSVADGASSRWEQTARPQAHNL